MCPSCCTRRMAATTTHLVEQVFPELPVRQWAVPFPKRLRYFLHSDGFGFTGSQRTAVYPEGRDQGIECRVWPPNGLEKMAFEPPILGTGRQAPVGHATAPAAGHAHGIGTARAFQASP